MIEINSFRLTPNIYFGIIVRRHLKIYWWLYSFMFLLTLKLLFSNDGSSLDQFMIIYGIICLPIILIFYYFWATSSKNNTLFQERQLKLENEKLSMSSDGIYSELPYKHVQKIVETKNYLLLYIANAQFVYIPKIAFVNLEDIERFKKLIRNEVSS